MLRGELSVLQAPMLDGLALDASPFGEHGVGPAEVDVGRRRHLGQFERGWAVGQEPKHPGRPVIATTTKKA